MIIMKDTGVYFHNLGIFLGQGVLVTECIREEEFLHVAQLFCWLSKYSGL